MTDRDRPDPTKQPAPSRPDDDAKVEEADKESFPASDPPAWTHTHPGPPTEPTPRKG